jgi:hypothetical protein
MALVERAGQSVPACVRRAVSLSEYAVEPRYPGLSEPVTWQEYMAHNPVPRKRACFTHFSDAAGKKLQSETPGGWDFSGQASCS